MTSLQAVRSTHEACERILKIFRTHNKKIRVKDIHLHQQFVKELTERLPACKGVQDVPQVFVNFEHIGDGEKVFRMNEEGRLERLIRGFEVRPAFDPPRHRCARPSFPLPICLSAPA